MIIKQKKTKNIKFLLLVCSFLTLTGCSNNKKESITNNNSSITTDKSIDQSINNDVSTSINTNNHDNPDINKDVKDDNEPVLTDRQLQFKRFLKELREFKQSKQPFDIKDYSYFLSINDQFEKLNINEEELSLNDTQTLIKEFQDLKSKFESLLDSSYKKINILKAGKDDSLSAMMSFFETQLPEDESNLSKTGNIFMR